MRPDRPSQPGHLPSVRSSRLLSSLGSAFAAAALFTACLPAAAARTALVFGDSLSAAYGLAADQGWVHLLGERAKRLDWRIVNASISGETTAGGLRRLPEIGRASCRERGSVCGRGGRGTRDKT